MEPESTPVVPANRLLEVAGVLSEGASRLHEQLRHLPPAERQALLDVVVAQVGDIVHAWSELVRAVVSVDAGGPQGARGVGSSISPVGPARAPGEGPGTAPPEREPPAGLVSVPVSGRLSSVPVSDTGGPARAERVSSVADPGDELRRRAEPSPAPQLASYRPPSAAPAESPAGASGTASRDELTGVLNRQAGWTAMTREVERSRGSGLRFVLGYLNVDGLRRVNEADGPRAGDELLRKVAAALRATLRSYDVVLRLAGDEFLFSLPGADLATAEQRLREFGVILGGEAPGASVSVGFAELHEGESLDELVARADEALVQARRQRGRPRLR